jgi:hypothetical protein
MNTNTLPRLVARSLQDRLRVRPAEVVTGARQTGKSTLVQELVPGGRKHASMARTRRARRAVVDGAVGGTATPGDRLYIHASRGRDGGSADRKGHASARADPREGVTSPPRSLRWGRVQGGDSESFPEKRRRLDEAIRKKCARPWVWSAAAFDSRATRSSVCLNELSHPIRCYAS